MPKYRRYRKRGNKLSKQVYKNKKQLKRLNQAIEYKNKDSGISSEDCSTVAVGAAKLLLNDINEGTDRNTRIGSKVTARRILIRGYIHNEAHDAGTPGDGIIRMLLLREIDNSGGALDLTDMLQDDLGNTNVMSPMNMDREHNYKIYYDTMVAYDTTQHSVIPFKIKMKLKFNTDWDKSTGGGVADIMGNAFHFACFSQSGTAADSPRITAIARFSYCDM